MMKRGRIGLRYRGRRIFLDVEKCGYFGEAFGLMFKNRENAQALLFDFSGRGRQALHSLFVFFPFIVLWLDDKNKVLEAKVVEPFSFNVSSKKPFSRIVEVPINRNYKEIIKKLMKTRRQGKI